MKDRFYRINVVESIPKMKELGDNYASECRKKLAYTIVTLFFCIAIAVCGAIFISPITTYFSTPATAGIFSRLFYLRFQEFKILKLISADYNDYAVWMEKQLNKGNPQKETHLQEAIDAYKKYTSNPLQNTDDIAKALQHLLKTKTDNQILVSVLCGLLFCSGDKKYRDEIFAAKHKKGAAGNMVLRAWILYFDKDLSEDITFEKLKNDFMFFWNKKC